MNEYQIARIIKKSLLYHRTHDALKKGSVIHHDIGLLFQLLAGDAALLYGNQCDVQKEFDKSPQVFEFLDSIVENYEVHSSKIFVIDLARQGFFNLHYLLVCKYYKAFDAHERKSFSPEAQAFVTLMS